MTPLHVARNPTQNTRCSSQWSRNLGYNRVQVRICGLNTCPSLLEDLSMRLLPNVLCCSLSLHSSVVSSTSVSISHLHTIKQDDKKTHHILDRQQFIPPSYIFCKSDSVLFLEYSVHQTASQIHKVETYPGSNLTICCLQFSWVHEYIPNLHLLLHFPTQLILEGPIDTLSIPNNSLFL